ncbi:phage tail fiber domain-containing protein [Pseudomonas antarctica]|uniref:phage tail fiber domain-containing protein n=1 Tax=Pseudomonas antarctica TaxID=219572 RepID=UPI00387B07A7
MAAPKTVLTYPLNGAQKDFTIPFEYLARKFVVVTLIGNTRRVLILNSDYRFTSRTTITTTKAWGPGDLFTSIELRRVTSATERLVDFADGSILRAYDLNTSQVQSLHIAEEARDLTADTIGVNNDGDLDARGRKIVNVADGVLDGDSVNMGQTRRWSESALNQANRSEAQANLSNSARVNAENAQINSQNARDSSREYRDTAQLYRDQSGANKVDSELARDRSEAAAMRSGNSATASQQSAVSSQNSNVNSTGQADRASREADRAKTEADKLGNANQFMGTIQQINGSGEGAITYFNGPQSVRTSQYIQREGATTELADALRLTHLADGRFILVDDKRGKVRFIADTDGGFYPQGSLQCTGRIVAEGSSIISKAGSVGNAHFWLTNSDGSTRAVIYAGADKQLHLRAGEGPGELVLEENGDVRFSRNLALQGGRYIAGDGNIASPIFYGGTLYNALGALDTPHKLSEIALSSQAVGNGTVLNLTDDAFNFESLATLSYSNSNQRVILTGMRELAQMPIGTSFFITVGAGGWVPVTFADTNPAQRRVLRFGNFSSAGFTGIVGYKRVPYRP